jgi:hypothetical protein
VSCYERGFLEQGGADVEDHFVPLTFLPFDETESNKMLASFVKHVGEDEVTGLGAAAWAGGVLLRDTLADIVAEGGPNAVTRAALLDGLANTHDFDARGMWGTTDIGAKQPSVCGVMTQVQDGEFVRLRPKRPGTLRCEPRDLVTVELDLR